MRFATGLPGASLYPPIAQAWESRLQAEDFQQIARTADELGFDSIAIPEHIVVPTDMIELMGSHWPHAMTAMAFVAGATSRLKVDASVIVLPYHQPVALAKAVSTLDVLSGGRVRLSVGVGHSEPEFEVLGVPFHERGRMTDEYLAAMVELWTSEQPEFHGRYVSFDDIAFAPKPRQVPHPPIVIGGNSRAAIRRAARHDGWFPWLITPDELPGSLEYLRSQPHFESRTRGFDVVMPLTPLDVDEQHRPLDRQRPAAAATNAQQTIDAVGRLHELGVTRTSVRVQSSRSLAEYLDGLRWVAEEVMPACP